MNGKIAIDRLIAKGGMSYVYHAYDKASGHELAIKSCGAGSLYERNALEKEYDILCRINSLKQHDDRCIHVPCVYGLSEYDDRFSGEKSVGMVMEYIDGRVPAEVDLNTVIVFCKVLGMLHSMDPSVYYCDVKPDNIIIGGRPVPDGCDRPEKDIMIIDFGSAYCAGDGRRYNNKNDVRFGTLYYAAPEQFDRKADINARTDIYGIGKLLCTLSERHDREKNKKTEEYDKEKLNRIIKKCTCRDNLKRYCDIPELLYDLYEAAGKSGIIKSTIII